MTDFTYKYREIPDDSLDSELSDIEISEPVPGQQQPVNYFISDSSSSDNDPENNVPLANSL